MRRTRILPIAALVGAALVAAAILGWPRVPGPGGGSTVPRGGSEGASVLGAFLGGEAATGSGERFARAHTPRAFVFPEDHGAHPDYQVEWWYFTGNLESDNGEEFGYQFTLFRFGLAPGEADTNEAPWRTHQVWMGHLALSDMGRASHHHAERLSRGGPGKSPGRALAGVSIRPFGLWLDDWTAVSGGDGLFPIDLRARGDRFALDLRLDPGKPRVLQGDRGLSRKSTEPGNASYYYSYTRLPTSGHIERDGERIGVRGNSWMDREWSTSALSDEQAGWDWFSLQLDDGRDLMFYRMRRKDGGSDPNSGGVLVERSGTTHALTLEDVDLSPVQHWHGDASDRRYPVEWRLKVPRHGLDLNVRARFPAQEMRTRVTYWEGAVSIDGSHGGRGYLEMTGYAGP
ncbi:MAG: lipocalin-like domain-containing protein [Gammaproteobacteria bacterium]